MSELGVLTNKLNTWANKQDIERAYFFMSGYKDAMAPLYKFVIIRKEGSRDPKREIIDDLKAELSKGSVRVTVIVMSYCTDIEAKKTGTIPHYAIKITPSSSGRLRRS